MGVQEMAGAKLSNFCLLKLCAVLLTTIKSRLHSRGVICFRDQGRDLAPASDVAYDLQRTLSSSVETSNRRVWHLVKERKMVDTALKMPNCMCHVT